MMTIDDTFAFLEKENNLRFAKFDTISNSLWAPLIEKAYAKVKGNYYFISGDQPSNALNALTGAPVFIYNVSGTDEDILWKELNQASLVEYISIATTYGSLGQKNGCGLSERHSFTVL